MIDSRGFVYCPICQSKTKTKVDKDTVLRNFPLFCPKCKQESRVDVKCGNVKLSNTPVNLIITKIEKHISKIEFD